MILKHVVVLLFFTQFASVFGYNGRSSYNSQNEMDVYRLPKNTTPDSYDLKIIPDYNYLTDVVEFDGEVEIVINVESKTSTITLNCKNIVVYVVYVHEKITLDDLDVIKVIYDTQNEQCNILLSSKLNVGIQYLVNIEYHVKIDTNDMEGFYKSKYNKDSYTEWLLLTYIEPTGARRIFPCYDEPAYKTHFNITLTRPNNKTSRSNMPIYKSYYDSSVQEMRDIFVETPPISTYMVAFVISGFDSMTVESISGDSSVYVFADANRLDQVKYVSSEAPKLLVAMESFTKMRYELPKLDLFAVPDFKSDAVGNWGLNTFREKYLLLDDVSSTKAKELGLSMVQREMARQWFGNLVTCSWWDYMWLHDAFASYFQYFSMDTVYPDWRMNQMFVIEQHQWALEYDQSPRRAITASVQTPDDINDVFYDQTDRKAAAFLRMLKCCTNDTIFEQSLVRFLKLYKYESVDPDKLFAAFEDTIAEYQFDFGQDVNVTNFMKRWTEQAGYPMINVVKVNDEFIITQERCLMDTPEKIIDSSRWYIGITYTTESSKNFENLALATWCKPTIDRCILSAPQDPGWFIFNVQSTGFYRVNYDTDNWSSLIRQLKETPNEIHVLNRAQLVDDSFFLARADKLHYSFPLRISSYLKIEDDVLPWYSAMNGYSYLIERMRRNDTEYSDLRKCVSNLAGIIYKKTEDQVVEKNNTDHIILTSWNAFSEWACQLNNEKCIESAYDYYTKWQNGEKIPSDIRDAAFCVGIHITNDTSTWEQMLDLYTKTRSPSEKQSAQTAMACTEDDQLLSRYLNYTLESDGPIRKQDFKDVFSAISSTPKGLEVLIDFLVNNLNKITKKHTDGNNIAIFIYSICTSKAALDSEINKLTNLKDDPNTPEDLRKEFNESYKQVKNNLYWYNKYHEIVNQNTGCSQDYTTTDEPTKTTTQKSQTTTAIITQPVTETTIGETTISNETDTTIHTSSETSFEETTESKPTEHTTDKTIRTSPTDTTSSEQTDTTPHVYPETTSGDTTVSKYTDQTTHQSQSSTKDDTPSTERTDETTIIQSETTHEKTTVLNPSERTTDQSSRTSPENTTWSERTDSTTHTYTETTPGATTTSKQTESTSDYSTRDTSSSEQTDTSPHVYPETSSEDTTVSKYTDQTTHQSHSSTTDDTPSTTSPEDSTWSERTDSTTHTYTETTSGDTTRSIQTESTSEHSTRDTSSSEQTDTSPHVYPETSSGDTTVSKYTDQTTNQSQSSTKDDTPSTERTDETTIIQSETTPLLTSPEDTTWSERTDSTTHTYTETTSGDTTRSIQTELTSEHSTRDTSSSEQTDTSTHVYPETSSGDTTVSKYTDQTTNQSQSSTKDDTPSIEPTDETTIIQSETTHEKTTVLNPSERITDQSSRTSPENTTWSERTDSTTHTYTETTPGDTTRSIQTESTSEHSTRDTSSSEQTDTSPHVYPETSSGDTTVSKYTDQTTNQSQSSTKDDTPSTERTDETTIIQSETTPLLTSPEDTTWSERTDSTTHIYTETTPGVTTTSKQTESTSEHLTRDTSSSEQIDTTHAYPETSSRGTTTYIYTDSSTRIPTLMNQPYSSTGYSTETSELCTTLSDHTETSTEFIITSSNVADHTIPVPSDKHPYFNLIFLIFLFFIAVVLIMFLWRLSSTNNCCDN